MNLIWHIPGEKHGRIVRSDSTVGRNCVPAPGHRPGLQFGADRKSAADYILTLAGRFLSEKVKDKSPALLFSDGALGLAIQAAWPLKASGPLVIAVFTPAQRERARTIGGGEVLEGSDPGFVDRLKMATEGKGFETVLVASRRGLSIRMALGAAGVLGRVFLLLPASEPARVDLHSTINYKGLTVEGVEIFGGSSTVIDEELQSVVKAIAGPRMETLAKVLFHTLEDEEGDHFEIKV